MPGIGAEVQTSAEPDPQTTICNKKSDGILFGQAHTHHIRKYNKKEPGWQVATQQLV